MDTGQQIKKGQGDLELEALTAEFEKREVGIADLMEMYGLVENAYAEASSAVGIREVYYASNSTNIERHDA